MKNKIHRLKSKKYLFLFILVAMLILTFLVSVISNKSDAQNSGLKTVSPQAMDLKIPVHLKQLPLEKGVVPVELKCSDAQLSDLSTLERLPCVIVNNSNKNITAVVLVLSANLQGKQFSPHTATTVLVIETLLNRHLRELRKESFIPPKGESNAEPATTNYENETITGITMEIDYVEFEDSSTLGADEIGTEAITEIRDGAESYRVWLVQKYIDGGKSESILGSLLRQNNAIPNELNLKGRARQGAFQYRNLIRKIFDEKKTAELDKYLGLTRNEK